MTCTSFSILLFFQIHGVLVNTGHDLVFQINNPAQHIINITGGPFSYHYRIHEIHIHFGSIDEKGSEHAIDGYTYPAEVRVYLDCVPISFLKMLPNQLNVHVPISNVFLIPSMN